MLYKTTTMPYVIIVDGVWRQADVLDVPPQLRQHLHKNITSCMCIVPIQIKHVTQFYKKKLAVYFAEMNATVVESPDLQIKCGRSNLCTAPCHLAV